MNITEYIDYSTLIKNLPQGKVFFEKTGAEICKDIKSELLIENIPVLLFSAEVEVDVIAQSCGANGFINKPFEIVEMLQKIKTFLN